MRRKTIIAALVSIVLSVVSCQQFFTTSLGDAFARDSKDLVPKVSANNAADLAAETDGDAAASLELLDGLTDLIADADAEDKADLVAVALDVSSSASGVESAVLEESDELLDILQNGDLDDPAVQEDVYDLIDDALAGLDNLSESADAIVDIFSDPHVSIQDVAAASSAEDLAMAAVMLLASEASQATAGVSSYIDDFDAEGELTPTEALAVALAEAAAEKYEEEGGEGPLADLLDTLNLTS